jgi:hypothetical protein
MGSPTIFSGKYTKLLTQRGLMQQGGAVNQYDGQRNYIKNSSFENATADGWNRVKTTITNNLPSGTPTIGKLVSVAPSISSFGAFSGSAPFDTFALRFGNILSTVVAGEGVISDAFTVDPGDRGKVLTFKLYYQSDLGASTDNWSGVLGSQTWAVYIYDQTAGAWLQPTGFLGMNQNSGVGIVSGTFQSSVVAGQQYRIAVIALRNTTATSALQIDDVYVGPQTAPIGPVVTDWVSYTPTLKGTGSDPTLGSTGTITGRWRRVGDSVELYCIAAPSGTGITTGSGTYYFTLPSGMTIDSSKSAGFSPVNPIGVGNVLNSGVAGYNAQAVIVNSTGIGLVTEGATYVSQTFPASNWFSSTDSLEIYCKVPIQGWSSSVQMSNDTDTRVVALNTASASTQVIPNQAAEGSEPIFTAWQSTPNLDTHGGWIGGGQYRIPVSGQYLVSCQISKNQSTTNNYAIIYKLYKNGVNFSSRYARYDTPAVNQFIVTISGSQVATFNAGDVVDVRIFQNSGGNLTFGAESSILNIQRLSGPSVIAASETVAEIRQNTAGSIIGTTATKIPYPTTIKSTHNAWDSVNSRFTAPVSGTYLVSFLYTHVAVSLSRPFEIYFTKSGGGFGGSFANRAPTAATTDGTYGDRNAACINSLVSLNAGEFIEFYSLSPSGSVALFTSVSTNLISIVRVGN